MNGGASRRFWLVLVGLTVGVSLVPAWFAWQADEELDELLASSACEPPASRAPGCRTVGPISVESHDRFTWRVQSADGRQALVRLASDGELTERLRDGRPATAVATWWRGEVVALSWEGASTLFSTEAHPAKRRSWYGSVFGSVYLLLALSAVATRVARRRRS